MMHMTMKVTLLHRIFSALEAFHELETKGMSECVWRDNWQAVRQSLLEAYDELYDATMSSACDTCGTLHLPVHEGGRWECAVGDCGGLLRPGEWIWKSTG